MKCSVCIKVEDLGKWKAIIAPVLNMPDVDKLSVFFDTAQSHLVDRAGDEQRRRNRQKRLERAADLTGITVMKFAKSVDVVYRTK